MTKIKTPALAVSCGLITAALQLYLIPQFFMRGIHDAIWVALMLILPIIPAVILLHATGCPPRSVFLGLLAESVIAIVFCKAIGGALGYSITSVAGDLFDLIAYLMFALGFEAAASLVQFFVLLALRKCGGGRGRS